MSKYAFKPAQRYAVYKAFNGICPWCNEPVGFTSFHVDHVLPEELLNDGEKFKTTLESYGLPENFNINDYENWAPLHSRCNQIKSAKVYQRLGIIRTILDACENKKQLEQRIELMLNKEPKKAELLAKIQAAMDFNLLNLNELQSFLLKTDIMKTEDDELKAIRNDIEQRVEYQTAKMMLDYVIMLKTHTQDVLNFIAANLGQDWMGLMPMHHFKKDNDTALSFLAGLHNRVNDNLTISLAISPDIIDKKLVLTFRENLGPATPTEIFYSYAYDLEVGVNWEEYRELITSFFKERLKKV